MSLPACFSKSCPCCFSGGVMHANPLSECSPIMSAAISSHWHNKSNTKAGSLSLVHNIPTRSEVNALKCAGDEGCRRRRRTVALLMRPPVAAAVLRRGACAITGPDGKGSVLFGRAMQPGERRQRRRCRRQGCVARVGLFWRKRWRGKSGAGTRPAPRCRQVCGSLRRQLSSAPTRFNFARESPQCVAAPSVSDSVRFAPPPACLGTFGAAALPGRWMHVCAPATPGAAAAPI